MFALLVGLIGHLWAADITSLGDFAHWLTARIGIGIGVVRSNGWIGCCGRFQFILSRHLAISTF